MTWKITCTLHDAMILGVLSAISRHSLQNQINEAP
jgi:hypothetical protein